MVGGRWWVVGRWVVSGWWSVAGDGDRNNNGERCLTWSVVSPALSSWSGLSPFGFSHKTPTKPTELGAPRDLLPVGFSKNTNKTHGAGCPLQHAGHLELDQDDRNPFDFKKSSNQVKVVRRWSVVGGVWCVVCGKRYGGWWWWRWW